MLVESMQLNNKNKLNKEYRSQNKDITTFFHYNPYTDLRKRATDAGKRHYNREGLSEALLRMNKKWGATEATIRNIELLKQENSLVVIGGQQAGLLTGPMYSINKLISIIRLAKEQERDLGVPVIPVFWIAGEDHDFDEVNHIFAIDNQKLYKHTIRQDAVLKKSLSDMKVDKEKAMTWLQGFLHGIEETVYTKQWFQDTVQSLQAAKSYTDFFARLIFQIFPDQGLILTDAHAEEIRVLESEYFVSMIHNHQDIHSTSYKTLQTLQQKGYGIPLEMETDDVNLFYRNDSGERILLKYKSGYFVGKHDEVMLTTEELLNIAENNPERLSNNVITRPLMQELLFPTLAFVAGDGEINYWATLKKSFEVMGIKMPPVMPRLSFTYVSNHIQKLLAQRVLEAEGIIQEGIEHVRMKWLQGQSILPANVVFNQVKQSIANVHEPLQTYAEGLGADLKQLSERNLEYIEQQIDYLKQKAEEKLESIFEHELHQFDLIGMTLKPKGVLQERIWNPYYFINDYGYDFFRDMIETENITFTKDHYIVYM